MRPLHLQCCAAAAAAGVKANFHSSASLQCEEAKSPVSYYGAYSKDRFGGGIGERVGLVEQKQSLPGTGVVRVTLVSEPRGVLRQWASESNWREATRIHKKAYFTRTENLVQEEVLQRVRQHYVACTEALDDQLVEAGLFRLEDEAVLLELLGQTRFTHIPEVVLGVFAEEKDPYVVDFANKRLGGGWLGYGMAQEEKMFIERFDYGALCARSLLEMPRSPIEEPVASPFSMRQDEAWLLRGGLAYASVGWYGRTPKDGLQRLQLRSPLDDVGTSPTVVAIDAIKADFSKYEMEHLRMMIVKAYVGFVAAKADKDLGGCSRLSTGSWGCGAFFNNERVMFVVQAIAANLAGVELKHHSLGDGLSLAPAFELLEDCLRKKMTVSQVLDALSRKCAEDPAWQSKWRPPKDARPSAQQARL